MFHFLAPGALFLLWSYGLVNKVFEVERLHSDLPGLQPVFGYAFDLGF